MLASCKPASKPESESSLNAADRFIRSTLNGEFANAEKLLKPDSANLQNFALYKGYYEKLPAETRRLYREASYEVLNVNDVNDSSSIITFKNSYINKPMEVKAVQQDGKWLIDFTYTYDQPVK